MVSFIVMDGDVVSGLVFSGSDQVYISSGGTACATTLNTAADMFVYDGGLASQTLANNKTVVGNGRKAARKVWITDGNGRVCSPLLRYTSGNISSTLFSYEQEMALTTALEQKLEAVTGVDF